MRYISDSVISFSIRLEGRDSSMRISFTSRTNGGSTYSTDSEAVINALEKSPMYGRSFRRAPECARIVLGEKRSAKAEPKKKLKEVKEVAGWQDAAEYLVDNFGCEPGKLVTPDEILKEAAIRNLYFPNLK